MNKEKAENGIRKHLSAKSSNIFIGIGLILFSCVLFVCNAEAIAIVQDSIKPFGEWAGTKAFYLAVFTVGLIWCVLYCILGNVVISYLLMLVSTIVFGMCNRVLILTRAQYVTVAEIDVLDEAAEVKVDMGVAFHPIIIILVIWGLVLGFALWRIQKKYRVLNREQNKKKKYVIRILGLLASSVIFCLIYFKPAYMMLENTALYKNMGNVFWFCQSVFSNASYDVTQDEVHEIYDDFVELSFQKEQVSKKRPNIIVVMSEAFWDINNLEGIVEATENPMDKYFELTKDAVRGQVAVNIYGGGTNNSEFEFLTGINAKYITNKNCYNEYFEKEQESFVSYIKNLGYYTMAFHPYDGEYWERETGYSNMGFEEFYSDVDFENREMCHGYISDKSLTREIIERFEERKLENPEQPVFSFVVSVQNHVNDMGGFDEESAVEGCTGIITTVNSEIADEESIANVEEYYNGMRESVEALEELMAYFEQYKEDTIVVFFGDHAPLFVKLICDTVGREEEMNLYRTPYMIWTNYENDYESYGDINLSYLSSVLIEYLDFPKSRQYYVNKYMLEHCKINTRYERVASDKLEKQRILDAMNTALYMCDTFPEKENALPYWQIVE